jgi:hypothetical protein
MGIEQGKDENVSFHIRDGLYLFGEYFFAF